MLHFTLCHHHVVGLWEVLLHLLRGRRTQSKMGAPARMRNRQPQLGTLWSQKKQVHSLASQACKDKPGIRGWGRQLWLSSSVLER